MSRGVLAAILREHPVGDTLALGHDGLWIFADRSLADRILADRSLANRRRRRRRLLARQIGGGGSAQHAQQSNSAQHGDESGRAQQSKERSRHPYYDLHHANPLSLSKPSNDRPRDPYSPPAVE